MMPQAANNATRFRHHMLEEIYAQPEAVAATARAAESLEEIAPQLARFRRVVIAASGTSRHAAMAGKFMIESLAQIPAEVWYASEFQYAPVTIGPEALMLVITQSGETADTLAALRRAKSTGVKVLAVSNVADAPIMREADYRLHTKAGPELAVPSTKAFAAQLTALFVFTVRLGQALRNVPQASADSLLSELAKIPGKLRCVLAADDECLRIAQKYCRCEDFLFVGRGVHYPIAMDGALKLKEVSYVHAEGYPCGEIRHGPLALVDARLPVVALATRDRGDADSVTRYDKTVASIREIKERSGRVIAVTNVAGNGLDHLVDDLIVVPDAPELLSPILEIVPLQLLAYHIAVLRGLDVDRPRNLAKAVVKD
jgi:glucosamine--fructose-6-phosphate aminotransferase (isomerizing)